MHIILWIKYLEETIGSEMLKGGFTLAFLVEQQYLSSVLSILNSVLTSTLDSIEEKQNTGKRKITNNIHGKMQCTSTCMHDKLLFMQTRDRNARELY